MQVIIPSPTEFVGLDVSDVDHFVLDDDGRREWTISSWTGRGDPLSMIPALAKIFDSYADFSSCVRGVEIYEVDRSTFLGHLVADGVEEFLAKVNGTKHWFDVSQIQDHCYECRFGDFREAHLFSIRGRGYLFTIYRDD